MAQEDENPLGSAVKRSGDLKLDSSQLQWPMIWTLPLQGHRSFFRSNRLLRRGAISRAELLSKCKLL